MEILQTVWSMYWVTAPETVVDTSQHGGLQGIWSNGRWMRSFYNNNSKYNNFKNNPNGYLNTWRHISHIYDGRTVYVFVDGVQRLVVNRELNTMSRTSLTFGHFGNSTRGWNNDHLIGLLDDFRVYNDAFSQDEVALLYGNGLGDLSIQPEITVEPVIEGLQSTGTIRFIRSGEPVSVNNLSISDFSVVNGSMVENSLSTDDNITWQFFFSLEEENLDSSVTINAGAFTDPYGENSSSTSAPTRKMYRAVTRGDDLDAWWSFDRIILQMIS